MLEEEGALMEEVSKEEGGMGLTDWPFAYTVLLPEDRHLSQDRRCCWTQVMELGEPPAGTLSLRYRMASAREGVGCALDRDQGLQCLKEQMGCCSQACKL